MLPDLLQVRQTRSDPLQHSAHTTKSSDFQTLATVQGVTVLEELHVVFSNLADQVSSGVDLAKSELVVILVVEDVEEVSVERVDLVEARELFDDGGELLVEVGLCVLDFAHVELAEAVDFVALVDNGGSLALGA